MPRHPGIKIKHVDSAVRWKAPENRSRLLRIVGGSLQAIRDILRVLFGIAVFRPHVLHLTTSAGYASLKDAVIMLLARMSGTAGVLHYRTSRIANYKETRSWGLRSALWAMRHARLVLVLDNETYAFLQKTLPKHKVGKVPNMIDLRQIDDLGLKEKETCVRPETDAGVVFVGLVTPDKGVLELVEACTPLEGLTVHLVGPVAGGFREKLRAVAQKRGDAEWLRFYGAVEHTEACRHILRNDIFVLPSRKTYEAFPNALLEAMACAKPVVVSDVGAMAEMVAVQEEHPCGICVQPGDVESIRSALQGLLGRRGGMEAFGERGRKRVENLYSVPVVIEHLKRIWTNTRLSCRRV